MLGRWLETNFENVHYNLALEHAILFLSSQNDFSATVRVWTNPKAVILGRSQQISEEVDLTYCSENEITIGRRISGGGTVYHDLGNINLSIFLPKTKLFPKARDVKSISRMFSELIINQLKLELKTGTFSIYNENSILYNQKKFSGSAGYFRSDWFLHHFTLLFETNQIHLNHVLRAGRSDYSSKRPSSFIPTANLPPLSKSNLIKSIIDQLENTFDVVFEFKPLTESEIQLATRLANEMYSQKSWIWNKKRRLIEERFSPS